MEALRVYLEKQLGEETFCSVYKILSVFVILLSAYLMYMHIQNQDQDEDREDEIDKLLGPSKSKFLPLLYQMIVCEDEYHGNANKA